MTNMIDAATRAEVLRKAKNNIALTNPTKATTAIYSSYKTPATTAAKTTTARSTNGVSSVTGLKAGSVESAQAWINDPRSGQGGMQNYTAGKQAQYEDAYRNNDTGMMARLIADGSRAGYSLNAPKIQKLDAMDPGMMMPGMPDINGMSDAALAAKLAAIRSSQTTALSGLAGQDDLVKQSAYDNRNSNDVMAAQELQRLKETMAANGLSSSGDNITANVQLSAARQNGANSINQDEANKLKQLMAARDAIKNSSSQDEIAAISQNQADRMAAQLGQYNQDRSYGLQLGGLTGSVNGQRTLAGSESDWNRNPSNPAYQAIINSNKEAELRLKELQDPNSVTNRAKALDLQMKGIDAQYLPQEKKLALQELQKRIAEIGKRPALTAQEQRLNEIDLQKAEIELSNLKNGGSTQTAESMSKYFDGIVRHDSYNGEISNKEEVEKSILASGLSEYETYRSYLRYGIPWNGPIPQPGK